MPLRTVLQETRDGGKNWSASQSELTKAFYDGSMLIKLMQFPGENLKDLQFADDGFYAVTESGQCLHATDKRDSWAPVMAGLDIPRVDRLFVPLHGKLLFASTPAGVYQMHKDDTTWKPSHLVMQWKKNERRELGGAAFITAYWRALYFGHLDPEIIRLPYDQASKREWSVADFGR